MIQPQELPTLLNPIHRMGHAMMRFSMEWEIRKTRNMNTQVGHHTTYQPHRMNRSLVQMKLLFLHVRQKKFRTGQSLHHIRRDKTIKNL